MVAVKNEIKRLLMITDEKGTHVMMAKDVVKATGLSANAVYQSRKNGNKLDKLAAFNRIQELVDKHPEVLCSGDCGEEEHF